ncbi:MAG: cytidylyltransferase domain-containing protein [Ferrovibrio sp.]|uniref:cytidylyltransferase domain-containing protein n=1 Tax=Ferrovibrio sp. TaxID=1917215 RepID=UPI00391A253B
MTTISVLINARTKSSRLPRKLVLPFAGSTLIDVALEKLDRMDFFSHRYFAVAEDELRQKAVAYRNIEILDRDPAAVQPGYNDHRKVFAHYERVKSDYIMWLNPCHPLISLDTIRRAVDHVLATGLNSYTSVIPTTDWIFDSDGNAVTNTQAGMLSTAHSRTFFKVAHAFHVIRKAFFLKDYQYWTLTKNDPALIEIPVEESYDVNDAIEFEVAQAAYARSLSSHGEKQ